MAEIKAVEDYEVGLIKPKNFNSLDPENDIKKIDEAFEKLCSTIEDLGISRPHKLSVFKFLSKIRYFNKKSSKK